MTTTATYTFDQAIERIGQCTHQWELLMLAEVLEDERGKYSLYQLQLLCKAIEIMREVVVK